MGSRSRNTGGGGSIRQSHTQPSPLAVPRMKSLVLLLCLFLACGPLVSGLFWGDADSDGDGVNDANDDDDDNDGLLDVEDDDDDGDGIADEDEDHDGDGVSNDDGDGVLDGDEDDDADGVENDEDPDDDGDGVLD